MGQGDPKTAGTRLFESLFYDIIMSKCLEYNHLIYKIARVDLYRAFFITKSITMIISNIYIITYRPMYIILLRQNECTDCMNIDCDYYNPFI